MKYKKQLFLFVVTALLAGCANNSDAIKKDTQEEAFTSVETSACKIEEYTLSVPENTYVDAFCYEDKYIYYGVSYSSYFESIRNAGGDINFSDEYATQIRRYNVETANDELVYQYDVRDCVEITDMQYDNGKVIWEDYLGDNSTWRVVGCKEESGENLEILFSSDDMESGMNSVTILAENDAVYWYDKKERDETYTLYCYQDEEIESIRSEVFLTSPYQHVSLLDGLFAGCNAKGEQYGIRISNSSADETYVDTGNILADNPKANDNYCVWSEADNTDRIYIYSMQMGKTFSIQVNGYFSYGLLSDYLIVNSNEGVLVYNLEDKTYCNVQEGDEHLYLFTFQDSEKCLYAQRTDHSNVIGVIFINE